MKYWTFVLMVFTTVAHSTSLPSPQDQNDPSERFSTKFLTKPQDTPVIDKKIENSSSFRELMTWFDDMVYGWITQRKNYVIEQFYKIALSDNLELLDYILNPNNRNFRRIPAMMLRNMSTIHQKQNRSDGLSNYEKREVSSFEINKTHNYCSSQVKLGEDMTPMEQVRHYDLGGLIPGCSFIVGDLTFKKYLVCDSDIITTIPPLPIEELDMFELNSTQVSMIPPHSFGDSVVKALRINQNPIQYIHSFAFVGLNSTSMIQFTHNKLAWIWFDDVFTGLDKLISLQLDFNEISFNSIEDICQENRDIEEIPTVLPMLMALTLRQNPLHFIPKTFFAPLRRSLVNFVSLENCELEEIHPDVFTFLPKLLNLDLSENPQLMNHLNISFIGLAKTTNLTKLNLGMNALMKPPKEALELVAKTLTTLDLRDNPMTTLRRNSFPDFMKPLKNLQLVRCNLKSLEDGVFDGMPNLETLMLNGNQFKQIPAPISKLINLNILDLSNNVIDRESVKMSFEIPINSLKDLINLKTLSFSNTWIKFLEPGHFRGLVKLTMLSLDSCNLEYIEDFTFNEVKELEILDLSGNDLGSVNSNTFYGLTTLQTLSMNSAGLSIKQGARSRDYYERHKNKKSSRKKDRIDFVTLGGVLNAAETLDTDKSEEEIVTENILCPFKHLKHLQYLNLNDNKLMTLHSCMFQDLEYLHSLDLSKNKIETWQKPIFQNNQLLEYIYLNDNELYSISDAMLEDFVEYSPPQLYRTEKVHKSIDLSDNQLQCDQGTCKLKTEFENSNFILVDWKKKNSYQCRIINGASSKIDISTLNKQICEKLDEKGDPKPIPTTTTSPSRNTTDDTEKEYEDPTTQESITTEEDTSNRTTEHDPSLNPGKENGKYSLDENIPTNQSSSLTNTLIILFSCIGIFSVVGYICYRKKFYLYYLWFGVKVNVLRHMRRKAIAKRTSELCNESYTYDVFISYSHSDSEFIQDDLVPELEGSGKFIDKSNFNTLFDVTDTSIRTSMDEIDIDNNSSTCNSMDSIIVNSKSSITSDSSFKVCLHVRDFQVGAPITENIIECVDRSNKILIIISKKYLESQWCLFEMNLAYHRLVEARRNSFILILLEDIPVESRTKVLNHLMKSRTYLEWPRPGNSPSEYEFQKRIFWKRLKSSLAGEEYGC